MKIGISIDSACDLPKELIEKHNIHITPFYIMLGDKECVDGEISQEDIFEYVAKTGTLPKTAAISKDAFIEHFKAIAPGYEHIIHFTISTEMSSSHRNAVEASKEFNNVHVVDSANLSSGIALLVLSCVDKIKEGKDISTILKEIEEEKPKVQASFLVDTLKFLYKGGRCNALSTIFASILKIKPKILVTDGKMGVAKKYMGNINGSLIKYVEDTLNISNPNLKRAFCTHSSKMEISAKIVQMLKDYGFEEVYDCDASSTICSHCGPNTLGILFMNK
ncbi:MAG: DegV family protein [Clostridia bacterium]|nr:DegV family protein [Clostridia bacterium]